MNQGRHDGGHPTFKMTLDEVNKGDLSTVLGDPKDLKKIFGGVLARNSENVWNMKEK